MVSAVASLFVMFVLAGSATAAAATIEVDTSLDQFGDPTPIGLDPLCSLREAVQAANSDANFDGCERVGTGTVDDKIVLTGGTTYGRNRVGLDDSNVAGDLDVTGVTTIQVKGAGKARIDAGDIDRVIDVRPDARLDAARVVVENGTVATGDPSNSGGGLRVANGGRLTLVSSTVSANVVPGNTQCICGGGIATSGTTTLKGVMVRDNHADVNIGGGIALLDGKLRVLRSTIAGNVSSGGGGLYLGSGIEPGRVTLDRTTISGNEAIGESFGGGGIFVSASAATPMRATNVTISGNSSNSSGGGIKGGNLKLNAATVTANTADANGNGAGTVGGSGGGVNGPVDIVNSIVAGNFATNAESEDCTDASFIGHNLVGKATGCFEGGTNVATSDAKLRPLGAYGGPNLTHALKLGSPAIGKAGTSAPTRDQRGVRRDTQPDVGAYER